MSVLNSVNGKHIDDIYHIMQPSIMLRDKDRKKELKLFMEKRKCELDMTNVIDDGVVEKPPLYRSVCSVETDSDLSDDESDDDASIASTKSVVNLENDLSKEVWFDTFHLIAIKNSHSRMWSIANKTIAYYSS